MENSEHTKVKPYTSGVYRREILWMILLVLVGPIALLFIKDPIVSQSVLIAYAYILGLYIFVSIKYGARLKKRNKELTRLLAVGAAATICAFVVVLLEMIFNN